MAQYRAIWTGWPTPIRWRSISWAEHRQLDALPLSPVARCLETYRICLVDGPSLLDVPYGIAYWIGRQELLNSPFSGDYKAIKQCLDNARAWVAADYLNSVQAVVAWTFHYTPEEIERWDAIKLFRRLAQAEFILGKPIDPVNSAAPKEEQEKTKKKNPVDPRVLRVLERRRQNAAAGLQ